MVLPALKRGLELLICEQDLDEHFNSIIAKELVAGGIAGGAYYWLMPASQGLAYQSLGIGLVTAGITGLVFNIADEMRYRGPKPKE